LQCASWLVRCTQGMARYLMANRSVINISLHITKHCGMYADEYKN
jgi:hypothetical protein